MKLTRSNYEEYFLSYVDNELNAEEKHAVEAFIQENPDLKQELQLLQRTVLEDEIPIVFEHKSLLYKKEQETAAIIIPFWKKLATVAAAAILVLTATVWVWYHPNRETNTPHYAAQHPRESSRSAKTQANVDSPTASMLSYISPEETAKTSDVNTSAATMNANMVEKPKDTTRKEFQTTVQPQTGNDQSSVAMHLNENSPERNTVTSTQNLPIASTPLTALNDAPAATAIVPQSAQIITLAEKKPVDIVTSTTAVTYHTLEDNDQKERKEKILFVNTDDVANGSVKSFFRKAGRVIKRTSLLDTDKSSKSQDAVTDK